MIAHQRVIRERLADPLATGELFGRWWDGLDISIAKSEVRPIASSEAAQIILTYEWLGTMPQAVTDCFGLFHDGVLSGAVVFAHKPGANLSSNGSGIVPPDALYLARGACAHWAHPHAGSFLVSAACRLMARPNCCVLAYADPRAGEVGTIYQACNWYYLGPSRGGAHSFAIDDKIFTRRAFHRDRGGVRGTRSFETVRSAFPRAAAILPIPRPGRYLGVYGTPGYKRRMAKRLQPYVLPYPKRLTEP